MSIFLSDQELEGIRLEARRLVAEVWKDFDVAGPRKVVTGGEEEVEVDVGGVLSGGGGSEGEGDPGGGGRDYHGEGCGGGPAEVEVEEGGVDRGGEIE